MVMGETVTDICDNTYPVVTIGEQTWMAENLKCNKYDTESEAYNAGWLTNNTIPTSESDVYTPYCTDASNQTKWHRTECSDKLSNAQISKLGYLYNWAAAVGVADGEKQKMDFADIRQGICPNGWHIPTNAEWQTLKDYIEVTQGKGLETAGKHLKTIYGWCNDDNSSQESQGLDTYDFMAQPSGSAYGEYINNVGLYTTFWSATSNELKSFRAHVRTIYDSYDDMYDSELDGGKNEGLSVRCVNEDSISVNMEKLVFDASGGSNAILVRSNASWEVTTDQSWVYFDSQSSKGTNLLTITVSPSKLTATEYAVVTLITTSGHTATVKIKRLGKEKCSASDYDLVTIGKQVWMAENYRCSKYDTESEAYKNGLYSIPDVTGYVYSPYFLDLPQDECYHGFKYSKNLSCSQIVALGYLYNWSAAVGFKTEEDAIHTQSFINNRQGICPNGWHLPSEEEWQELVDYIEKTEVNGDGTIGKHLKTTGGWYDDYDEYCSSTDAYGFASLPAGFAEGKNYYSYGTEAYFWLSSTEYYTGYASSSFLSCTINGEKRDFRNDKKNAFSVRCLKNGETLEFPTKQKTIDAAGGSFNDKITSNTCWTATSDKNWATISATSGCGNQTLQIQVSENNTTMTDEAIITITTEGGTQTKTVTIIRKGKEKCNADEYPQVKIGNQIWMAENYRCSKYDTESEAYNAPWLTNNTIPTSESDVYTPYYTDATDNRNWWDPAKHSSNLSDVQMAELGYLYNWAAAVGVADGAKQTVVFPSIRQGICPNGWHMPSKAEWQTLKDYIEITQDNGCGTAGKHLKTTSGWYEDGEFETNPQGLDTYSFAALPVGDSNGRNVIAIGDYALFWSATLNEIGANDCVLSYANNKMSDLYNSVFSGQSVRCIKNQNIPTEEPEVFIDRSEETKLLDSKSIVPGSEVTIGITVSQCDKVKKVTLFYGGKSFKTNNQAELVAVSECENSTITYQFQIPGGYVCEDYEFINYCAEVETVDGNKVNSYDKWQFYIASSEQDVITRPMINNVFSGASVPCNDIVVSADITTLSKLIDVTLYYRDADSQATYQSVAMTSAKGKNYSGKIGASATLRGPIHCYIVATDSDGRYGYYGDSSSPMLITVNKTATASTQGAMKIEIGSGMTADCRPIDEGTRYRAYFKSVCNGSEFEWLAGESVWNSFHGKEILTVYGNTNGDTSLKNGFNEGEDIIIKAVNGDNQEYVLNGHGLTYSIVAKTKTLDRGNACSGQSQLEVSQYMVDFGECDNPKTVTLRLTAYGCEEISIKSVSLEKKERFSYFTIPEFEETTISCGETIEIPVTYVPTEDDENCLVIEYYERETPVSVTVALTGKSKRKSMCSGISINKGLLNTDGTLSGTLQVGNSTHVEMSLKSKCIKNAEELLNGIYDGVQDFSAAGKLSEGDYKITIYTNDKVCEYFLNVKK